VYRLEDSGVVTDCSLKTLEPQDILDFNFNSANVTNKVIIKVCVCVSEWFVVYACSTVSDESPLIHVRSVDTCTLS